MQTPEKITGIIEYAKTLGKHYEFGLNDAISGINRVTSCYPVQPGKISDEDALTFIQDIEDSDSGFTCLTVVDTKTEWIIWDPKRFNPRSAFKKHRRSQSDQKVSKKRSKNKKTKRSGKKRSTRKTSKRKPRRV